MILTFYPVKILNFYLYKINFSQKLYLIFYIIFLLILLKIKIILGHWNIKKNTTVKENSFNNTLALLRRYAQGKSHLI